MSKAAVWTDRARLLPCHAAALAAAAGLKIFYSRADADDLVWILGPTSWVVELLSGIRFERELRAGFISHSHRMILEPACAGVNFLVISFSMLACGFVHRIRGSARRWGWLAAGALLSYLVTVLTNASRIVAAIQLRDLEIYGGAVTPDRVHRLTGVVVYCLSLMGLWLAADRLLNRSGSARGSGALRALIPLGWYLAFAVGAPILNRAWRHDPEKFAEHALMVVSFCLLAALACLLARISRRDAAHPR